MAQMIFGSEEEHVGKAEDAIRQDMARRQRLAQQEAASSKAEYDSRCRELTRKVRAEAQAALRRLESAGYPNGKLEVTEAKKFLRTAPAPRAYWTIQAGTYTYYNETLLSYWALYADGSFGSLPADPETLEELLEALKKLCR